MPLKKSKPKTPQQLEELIELLRANLDVKRKCDCAPCTFGVVLYDCSIDTLLYAIGKEPKNFCKMVRRLKRNYARQTKHQCSHSE
jgi:hypothetical protein